MRPAVDDDGTALQLARTLLAIDVGAGTQDILLYDADKPLENCFQLVLPSQTTVLSARIRKATEAGRDIFLHGNLMGGGPLVSALKKHLRAGLKVYAEPLAAKTVRDNPAEVEAQGIQIVSEPPEGCLWLRTADVDVGALRETFGRFELEWPERAAVAVQDHGETLSESQRRFRFRHWEAFLGAGGALDTLSYIDLPDYVTRMRAVQQDLPGALMMDTGSAAILGALQDPEVACRRGQGVTVVNVGNQHTFGVLVQGQDVWGLFEHHTALLDRSKLAALVARLQRGQLTFGEVFGDNGHGAAVRPGYVAKRPFEFVAITGPNRKMADALGYHPAAPYGDMMMTGPFGLVAAARARGLVR